MYGLPKDMPSGTASEIFEQFLALPASYALERKADSAVTGFILDVPPELPEEFLRSLPEGGRTLAYATFPAYQRQGYMREALGAVIRSHFKARTAGFIHCGHFSRNIPSRCLLRSLGFSEYGRHAVRDETVIDEILLPLIVSRRLQDDPC